MQNLVGTHHCPTFEPAARLPPLPLTTFVHATRLPSTSSTCVGTHCKTSLLPTAILHLYVLLVCCLHRRPVFVRVAEAHWYALLSYIHTRCSYAVNTADLCSYALQNLVGTHGCPTFVHAARLPSLPLATFVRAPRLPSTSSTCIRTRSRTSLVHTAVVHSNTLHDCHHYRWIHSYLLLVCHEDCRPAFVRVAKPRCHPLLSYIYTCCSSAVYIVDLCSYALPKLIGTHCCHTFVRAARMQSTLLTCIRMRCTTSLVRTAVLHSYMLHVCLHYHWLHSYALLIYRQHCRPAFVSIAEPRWYTLLSNIRTRYESAAITAGYIRTCCSSAVNIVDLRSYALQQLVGMHCSTTLVHATRMQSTTLTCVHTCCRTSLVHTAVLHSYMLHVCRHFRWLHLYVLLVCSQHRRPAFVHVAKPRCYPLLSYIRRHCLSGLNIVYLP